MLVIKGKNKKAQWKLRKINSDQVFFFSIACGVPLCVQQWEKNRTGVWDSRLAPHCMRGQQDTHTKPKLRNQGDTILTAPFSYAEAEPGAA